MLVEISVQVICLLIFKFILIEVTHFALHMMVTAFFFFKGNIVYYILTMSTYGSSLSSPQK